MSSIAAQKQQVHPKMIPDGVPSISLLGVKVHRVTMAMTIEAIRGFIASGKPHMIVTADASMIAMAQSDSELKEIVNAADLVTPDGSGLIKGAKILGTPLVERVSGVDICRKMCAMSAEMGFSVFFLGSEPGIAEAAAENLQKQFPGMRVAGTQHGYFKPDQDAEIVTLVRESGAGVLLAGMGIPRQEKWIKKHLNELGVCVAMGVGGSMDIFSGKIKRAPVWMQNHGLEWIYRLCQDPSKIKKVAILPKFLLMVVKEKVLGVR
ncbi:MAG: WecB/TagA/CpsF family glycosyltransferase [Armatimonadetes bacterium]|nr:WecB/TagA/CpsF family glycosyltransferase [Armatimonadota bacterium]